MKFNLNQFLLAISDALDFVEIDTLGATKFHSKRVAYISLRLAEFYSFSDDEKFDLCSFAILHDNGLCEESTITSSSQMPDPSNINILEQYTIHCDIGEKNITNFPFLTNHKNIVKYHHERFDGRGYFKLKGDQIPLMAQIISLADTVDNLFHFENISILNRAKICQFINDNIDKYYSKELVEHFNTLSKKTSFWLDLQSINLEQKILDRLQKNIIDIEYKELISLSAVFSQIVDSNSSFTSRHSSGLSDKVKTMANFYNFDYEKVSKLIIAANLHDLGKLAIPNAILEKNGKLTHNEFETIKSHTYYTRQALEKLDGFEEIVNWAANHHEKLNGEGYPYGISGDQLSFEERLMTCLDIYQALTEDRPYRAGMTHEDTMSILNDQGEKGYIDLTIVKDINKVFSLQ
jgi:HD-GYP domain-containing protein (c-di-GMP phosphodiesterase class II)